MALWSKKNGIRQTLQADIQAVFDRDPAAQEHFGSGVDLFRIACIMGSPVGALVLQKTFVAHCAYNIPAKPIFYRD